MTDLDRYELAAALCSIEYNDDQEVEDAMEEMYGMDWDRWEKMADMLHERLQLGISPLTKEVFIGFADAEKAIWLSKKPVRSQFISVALGYFGPDEDQKGAETVIKLNGKPSHKVVVIPAEDEVVIKKRKYKDNG